MKQTTRAAILERTTRAVIRAHLTRPHGPGHRFALTIHRAAVIVCDLLTYGIVDAYASHRREEDR